MATEAMAKVSEAPGTGETTRQDDDQGVLIDTPEKRKNLVAAARTLVRIEQDRGELSAEKRSVLESLVADGVSRKAIERAVKDCDKGQEKLERLDFYYSMTRSALGKPIQGQLFGDDIKH